MFFSQNGILKCMQLLFWHLESERKLGPMVMDNVHMYFRVYSMGYMLVDLLLCTYMKQIKLCFDTL